MAPPSGAHPTGRVRQSRFGYMAVTYLMHNLGLVALLCFLLFRAVSLLRVFHPQSLLVAFIRFRFVSSVAGLSVTTDPSATTASFTNDFLHFVRAFQALFPPVGADGKPSQAQMVPQPIVECFLYASPSMQPCVDILGLVHARQSLAAATRDVFAPLLTAWRQHLLGQAAAVAAPISPSAPIAPSAPLLPSAPSPEARETQTSATQGIHFFFSFDVTWLLLAFLDVFPTSSKTYFNTPQCLGGQTTSPMTCVSMLTMTTRGCTLLPRRWQPSRTSTALASAFQRRHRVYRRVK